MSSKCRDGKGRWRSVTVGFRVSREESEAINEMVKLSGMTKQDYCISRLLNRDIIVARNPRAFKGLKDSTTKIHDDLSRITESGQISGELLDTIRLVADIVKRMKE